MKAILHPLCAAVTFLGLLYKLQDLRHHPRDRALRVLCATLALSSLSFVVSIPLIWVRIDELFGIPNIAALIAQGSVMALVALQHVLIVMWSYPPQEAKSKIRVRLLAYGAVLTTLIVLFFLMAPADQAPHDFTLRFAADPYYAVYLSLYICVYTVGQLCVARLCWRYAQRVQQLWMRRGLRLVAVGASITLGYSAIRLADLAAARVGADLRRWEEVAWTCGDLSALLTVLGWTMPGWGPALTRMRSWIGQYWQHRQLYPLWQELWTVIPEIRDEPAKRPLPDWMQLRELDLRLYYRFVDIRDGRLALQPYLDSAVADTAMRIGQDFGLSDEELTVTVEAAVLKVAIAAKCRGDVTSVRGVDSLDEGDIATSTDVDAGRLPGEIELLTRVSRAFAHSPVVAAVVAEYASPRQEVLV